MATTNKKTRGLGYNFKDKCWETTTNKKTRGLVYNFKDKCWETDKTIPPKHFQYDIEFDETEEEALEREKRLAEYWEKEKLKKEKIKERLCEKRILTLSKEIDQITDVIIDAVVNN